MYICHMNTSKHTYFIEAKTKDAKVVFAGTEATKTEALRVAAQVFNDHENVSIIIQKH